MDLMIKHDETHQQFSLTKDNKESVLKYNKVGPNTLDYYSTFVPGALRGQGIAGLMTDYALRYAKDNHYLIIPSCPYVKSYIDKHPEYLVLLKNPSQERS